MTIDPRIIDRKLIDDQHRYVAHLRMLEMVAKRNADHPKATGADEDKLSKARRAYETALAQLDEMLTLRPELI